MQLKEIKKGWKPMTLAVGLLAGGTVGMYTGIDQYSKIETVLNNHITSRYIAEVNDPSEVYLSNKLLFENLLSSWQKNTRMLSSVQDIIEQRDFQAIVAMGTKAVPFIGQSIETQPSTLVWALNMIFNAKISDRKDLTISDACKLWVKELKRQGWM